MFEPEEDPLGDVLSVLAIYFAVVVVLIAPLVEANRIAHGPGREPMSQAELVQSLSSEPMAIVLTSD